eukprot:scaffold101184_cov68-Cyclotella_meneghiniana.AAC.1
MEFEGIAHELKEGVAYTRNVVYNEATCHSINVVDVRGSIAAVFQRIFGVDDALQDVLEVQKERNNDWHNGRPRPIVPCKARLAVRSQNSTSKIKHQPQGASRSEAEG